MKLSGYLYGAIAALAVSAPSVSAESSRLQADFSFKRVTVPSQNTATPRITVQIDPDTAVPVAAEPVDAGVPDAPTPPTFTGLDGFWVAVSPDLSDSRPGRLELAGW